MLTRCPSCATHFRVTAEQLKVRSGRVRCGACQHVFNALDSLIEEPVVVAAPLDAGRAADSPSPSPPDPAAPIDAQLSVVVDEIAVSPAPTPAPGFEPRGETPAGVPAALPESAESAPAEFSREADAAAAGSSEADGLPTPQVEDATTWSELFPEPPPTPRRWPWIAGSVLALVALGLQAVIAFRVELAVLWPQARPTLVTLCGVAGCEVGLPAKVALVGIEASDLHPDSEHPGRLALAATLKNRAPFAQRFPHLELTLTDTADQAIARKVLAPADYLPPKTSIAGGMQPNADVVLAVGVEPREMAASGYRLYLFYP